MGQRNMLHQLERRDGPCEPAPGLLRSNKSSDSQDECVQRDKVSIIEREREYLRNEDDDGNNREALGKFQALPHLLTGLVKGSTFIPANGKDPIIGCGVLPLVIGSVPMCSCRGSGNIRNPSPVVGPTQIFCLFLLVRSLSSFGGSGSSEGEAP